MNASVCPLCLGQGYIIDMRASSTSATCRGCNGKGIVFPPATDDTTDIVERLERYSQDCNCVVGLLADAEQTIRELRAKVVNYKEQAAKGTEYVLAQINEDLRAELTEMTKQRDHHASTIFINSVQIGNLRAEVARTEYERNLTAIERDAYKNALREIKDTQGKVCWNFELCIHDSCRSSYTSWTIALAALAQPEEPK